MGRVIKSPLDGTEVINFVGTTTDQNSGSTTVQDIANLANTGIPQINSNEVQAAPYTGVELPTGVGVNIGDTKTVQFSDGTVVNYTWDGSAWVANFYNPPTNKLFPDIYGKNVRIATGIIRPSVDVSGNVTWYLLNDADHEPVFFNTVSTPNPNVIRVIHPPVTKVLTFLVVADESLQRFGVIAGANVGLSYADISLSARYQNRQILEYNGSSWSNTGVVFGSAVNSGNRIIFTSPSGGFQNAEFTYANVSAIYAGTNNRVLRQVYSGVGYFQTIYELVDPVSGTAVAPDTNDKIILFNPDVNVRLNTQTTNTNHQFEKHVYEGSLLPNLWVIAVYVE